MRMTTEIRELDGERQSLVYNHHHELIEASDTIRKVSFYNALLTLPDISALTLYDSMSSSR